MYLFVAPVRAESQFPIAILEVSPSDFQSQILWGLTFQYSSPDVGLKAFTPQGGPVNLYYTFHLWVSHHIRCVGPDKKCICSSYSS